MDRARQWLHGRCGDLREWGHGDGLVRALAGVDALAAAGVLGASEAGEWRAELRAAASGEPQPEPPRQRTGASAAGERLLESLLQEEADERFEGALHLLGAAGLVDARAWHERRRVARGWPSEAEERALEREWNAGGTQAELRSVAAGPREERAGLRLLFVLVFADGVSCVLERRGRDLDAEEFAEWRLEDDLGTVYVPQGGGGSDEEEHVGFRRGPPPGATWLQLSREDDPALTFRVDL